MKDDMEIAGAIPSATTAAIPVYELQQEVPITIEVTTASLKDTGFLQTDFTCEGTDLSPHIDWDAVPDGTQSIAIFAEDLGYLGGIASHWIIWDIPADTLEYQQGYQDLQVYHLDL